MLATVIKLCILLVGPDNNQLSLLLIAVGPPLVRKTSSVGIV